MFSYAYDFTPKVEQTSINEGYFDPSATMKSPAGNRGLETMAEDLFAQVREENRSIRTLTVKIRYNDMAEDQASESLHEPTDLETDSE